MPYTFMMSEQQWEYVEIKFGIGSVLSLFCVILIFTNFQKLSYFLLLILKRMIDFPILHISIN